MNFKKILAELFPFFLKPEWVFCVVKEVPTDVLAAFYEEEMYLRKIGKVSMDIKIKGFRYKLTPKKEIFMKRRVI